MKKRNLMLLSAIAAASILMTGCGFTADDPADSQAVTITPNQLLHRHLQLHQHLLLPRQPT